MVKMTAFILAFLILAGAAFSALSDKTKTFTVGHAVITPVQDKSAQMDASLFHGASDAYISKLIPSGSAPASINVFLVKHNGNFILVDSGLGTQDSSLPLMLKKSGISPEQIDIVLLTHLHGDHIGGLSAGGRAAFPNAQVYVSRTEYDFWTGNDIAPQFKGTSELAEKHLSPYKTNLKTFDFGQEIIPGITALNAVGHTPGHTAYLLESGGEKLLFWGDTVHAAALQFINPEISASYDMNMPEAVSSRTALMSRAAKEKIPVAGAHLPFPGIGRISSDSNSFLYVSE